MKRALVLGGGGARGAFQVGMLRNLVLERGLDFQIIRGVSVGALNAAFLAQASTEPDSPGELKKKLAELVTIWRQDIQGNPSVYHERPGGVLGLAAGADSLYSLEPLRDLLKKHLSAGALGASGRDFAVGTVSLVSGLYAEWKPGQPHFFEKLMASASIPVVFPFVDIKEEKDVLVDGGARNITPLASVFRAQPDEIYVLLTSRLIRDGDQLPGSGVGENSYNQWTDNWLGTKVTGLDVLKRTVDILSDEVYLGDIRDALGWNEIVAGAEEAERAAPHAVARLRASLRGKRQIPLSILAPQESFGADNSSTDFSPELITAAIEHGETIARDKARWLWPPAS